jgi:hypothetical protein
MPSSYDKKESSRVIDTASSVGSFWLSRLRDKGQALSLIEAANLTRLLNQFKVAGNQLLGDNEVIVENIEHPIDTGDIIYSSGTRVDTGGFFDEDTDFFKKFDEGNISTWLLPLEKIPVDSGLSPELLYTVEPLRILIGGTELIRNVDFTSYNRHIVFYTDPRNFLKKGSISFTIATGVCKLPSIYRHAFHLETVKHNKYAADFIRNRQSPQSFCLAIASLAGQKITTHDQVLKTVNVQETYTQYQFEKETLVVPYEHTLLQDETYYPKDYIIGDAVRVYMPKPGDWWKDVDFKGGLAMAPITGTKGVLIPDTEVTAYVADMHELYLGEQKPHTRLELVGDPGNQDTYWDSVKDREAKFKRYLNDVAGVSISDYSIAELTDVLHIAELELEVINEKNKKQGRPEENLNIKRLDTAKKEVNALDVFFEGILGQQAFILQLDVRKIKNLQEVLSFVVRECPVGGTPIIMLYGWEQADDIAINTLCNDSFEVNVNESNSTEQDVSLSSIIVDTFELKKDTVT